LGLEDVSKISEGISKLVKKNARMIFGISQAQKQEEKIKITLLAVGCEADNIFPKEEKIIIKSDKSLSKKKIKKNKIINKKEGKVIENSQVDIKIRKNGIETKKEEINLEKEILEREKKWETPASLRRGPLDNNND